MNQEKFVNCYVELLNNTIAESIQKNLVLQTEKRVADQIMKEMADTFRKKEIELENIIIEKQKDIETLSNELLELQNEKSIFFSDSEELRKNVNHLHTLKSELIKERKENQKLKDELNKVTPIVEEEVVEIKANTETGEVNKKKKEKVIKPIEDAGSF